MIHTQRAHNHRSPPSISRPIPTDLYTPASPPKSSPHKTRRPSMTSPMTWLSRASSSGSSHSAPYTPSKPMRISEPRFTYSTDLSTPSRTGVLGSGATVVRTPQEALTAANERNSASQVLEQEEPEEDDFNGHPLPPIPQAEYVEEMESQNTCVPPPPSRPPPSTPDSPVAEPVSLFSSPPRSSFKTVSPPVSEYFPPVPALPTGVTASPPQPPFDAILVSPALTSAVDPAKVIVSLETSTVTHRTTLMTLTSRPSALATFLENLLPSSGRDSDTASIYSTASGTESSFNSIFQHHIASSGVLSSANIHIFLDRPSTPYAHILAYLRTPISSSESPATLPHAVQLHRSSSSRLNALLELRDEACYLGLDELHKLCLDELRQRSLTSSNSLGLHMRGYSIASSGSVRSLHTLRESLEPEPEPSQRDSNDSGFVSAGRRKSAGSSELEAPWPSPHSLQQRLALKDKTQAKKDTASLRSRPTGDWI